MHSAASRTAKTCSPLSSPSAKQGATQASPWAVESKNAQMCIGRERRRPQTVRGPGTVETL
jgi:hypothetical protein